MLKEQSCRGLATLDLARGALVESRFEFDVADSTARPGRRFPAKDAVAAVVNSIAMGCLLTTECTGTLIWMSQRHCTTPSGGRGYG